MEFSKVIEGRRSIRRYKDTPVSKEIVTEILNDARRAPSWKNMQCWRFIVVDDQTVKERIAEAFPEENPGRKAILSAPVCIVVCADPKESGIEDGKEYYLVDTAIAFEHIMLSAYDKGLGTCWMGWMDESKMARALDIPGNIKIIGITPLGYPDKEPRPIPRKELGEITYYNSWNQNF